MPVSSSPAPTSALTKYFADLNDPRREGSTDYPLHEIVVLTISAVICGADGGLLPSPVSAKRRRTGWDSFRNLNFGIRKRDSFSRHHWRHHLGDFSAYPEAFEACFSQWTADQLQSEISSSRRQAG
ncbi:MAG: hypothetical protein BRD41_03830 [Bacteroidetes bacterium QS_1_63_11]|nr:MAG: hypothetical protein BRD41_03830 [Bacteroidetes bacterium QS_1_63_11]